MANVITVAAQLDDSIIKLMDRTVIVTAVGVNKVDAFADVRKQVGGESIKFTKYSKLSVNTNPLVDGQDVDSEGMEDASVVLLPKEYGKVVTTTKLANLQTGGKADRAGAKLIGINLGETTNKLGINALSQGTNTQNSLNANQLTKLDLRQAYELLETRRALKYAGGFYACFMHPSRISQIKDDFIDIVKYTSQPLNGEVGALEGFRVISDPDVDVNKVICFGYGALGKAVSQEPGITVTGPFDKLGRMVNIGWYGVFEYGLVDDNAVQEIIITQ